jgi:hypothetical protein
VKNKAYGVIGMFQKGEAPKSGQRISRAEKFRAFAETWKRLRRQWTDTIYAGRVIHGEKGSLPALIALKCLDCACGQRTEIRDCVIVGCPLFPVRPFQRKADGSEDEGDDGGENRE